MKFNTIQQVKKALETVRNESTGKHTHYPILFKKALIEFMNESGIAGSKLAGELEIPNSLIYNWKNQHSDGLYTLAGAYSVSEKSLSTNAAVLKKLRQKLEETQRKIELVEECERLGLKVAV